MNIPVSPSVVTQPLLLTLQEEPGMFNFLRKSPWVLGTHRYTNQQALLAELNRSVIAPAETEAKQPTTNRKAARRSPVLSSRALGHQVLQIFVEAREAVQ